MLPHLHHAASEEDNAEQRQLQEAFHRGDNGAFNALLTPHLDLLYTHCLRVSGSPTEADDLAQETIIRAMTRHSAYDPSRAFRPWLMKIATNLCRDRLRTVWWKRVLPMSAPQRGVVPSPEHTTANALKDARVREALSVLPFHYKEALSLFYFDDLSYQEMSAITKTSIPALKQRVRRGRMMLREMMAEMYPDMGLET